MIHHHIDLGSVLRGTVCELYSNLVTRPTGAAVRTEIERSIAEIGGRNVTVIDFSQVMLLDFSCADEIVAKLMLRYCVPPDADRAGDSYFLFLGLGDHHLDAVEAVLERHRIAIVAMHDETPVLVGDVDALARATWEGLRALGPCDASHVAAALGRPPEIVADELDRLAARRLVVRLGPVYTVLGIFPTTAPEEAAA